MTMLDIALDLAARGAFIFPAQECKTTAEGEPDDRKRPKPRILWGSASTRDPAQITRWWSQWPDALIALDLGKMGIFVADADRHDPAVDGVQAWAGLCAEHGYSDAAVPRVSTASLGEHLYFRQPDGEPIGNKRVAVGVDGRGRGGYVIAPGSRFTDDGRFYQLQYGDILDPAPMPQWLADRLRGPTISAKSLDKAAGPAEQQTPPNVAFLPPRDTSARESAYGSKALEDEVMALAAMPRNSGRNIALNTAAFNLGMLVASGVLSQSGVIQSLVSACETNGLVKDDGIKSVMATIHSGLRKGLTLPRKPPEQEATMAFIPRQVRQVGDDLIDEETGEIIEAEAAQPEEPDDGLWAQPQGVVREIADWVMAVSHTPSWPLAIASAVATMATLCSRHMVGPSGLGSHLYILALASSGAGKNDPLSAPAKIMEQIDRRIGKFGELGRVYSGSDWASASAIERDLAACPTRLARIDEIEVLFKRVFGGRSSTHEMALSGRLKSLYSVKPCGVGSTFATLSRAGIVEAAPIEAPALTILGVGVPEAVFSSLTNMTTIDGFLNRWLIIDAPEWPDFNDAPPPPIPERILDHLTALFPAPSGNLGGHLSVLTQPTGVPDPHRIPFATAEDEARRLEFRAEVDGIRRNGTALVQGAYARAVENALRLAMVHAVGRQGRAAAITGADWDWAVSMVRRSVKALLKMLGEHMVENDAQAAHKRVFKLIKEAGRDGIMRRDLMQALGGAVKARDFNDIISALLQAEQVAESTVATGVKGGRPGIRYHCLKI